MPGDLSLFDLSGQVAIVTGGSGSLGKAIATGLAGAGANVAIIARQAGAVAAAAKEVGSRGPGLAIGVTADVLHPAQLAQARDEVVERWGRLDIIVNGAGGNQPGATVPPGGTFFDLDPQAVRAVVDLNLMGTFLPVQVLGRAMEISRRGSIINISSMAASSPLSRVAGYGAAKAAAQNLTRWLADHMARAIGPGVRVNAVAPGFFVADQNRALLTQPDGSLTERGASVVARTPMGRLGDPRDLVGTVIWLASEASGFVTGAVVPVDGGFSATAGI